MSENSSNILVLAGDGIGPEVCEQVENIIDYLNKNGLTNFTISHELIGGSAYEYTGDPLPNTTKEAAKNADAILLGAVGGPKWEGLDISVRPEKGLLGIRKYLNLFANLRPALVFDELADASSLKKEIVSGLDIMIIRELTGGLYFGEPKGVDILENGDKKGYNTLVYTSKEIQRIAKVAFELAEKRGQKVCSIDKANVLVSTELWRNEVQNLRDHSYQNIELSHMYVDNAAMQLVRNPKQFNILLTTNMFGDIISDIAAMLTGSLGMLPSASLGEKKDGKQPALYEPVHGSAPDIAGKDIANPIATILSFAMMLRYSFDMKEVADMVENAVKMSLRGGYRTADIMQDNMKLVGTKAMGKEIINNLNKLYHKKAA
ncbi:MAG: 3-isopropylmalate dehydrogenase [Pseudomonadota bacterium]